MKQRQIKNEHIRKYRFQNLIIRANTVTKMHDNKVA